jgi:hypothetical protein
MQKPLWFIPDIVMLVFLLLLVWFGPFLPAKMSSFFLRTNNMSIRSLMSKHSSLLLRSLARITRGFLSSGGETNPTAGG